MRVSNEDLYVMRVNDELRVSAPRIHFLSGLPLTRLHDGMSVPFDFQLTLFNGTRDTPLRRTVERFVVSYALWDENFKVVHVRGARRMGLSASGVEQWCLENLTVSAAGIPPGDRLWVRLEIRAQDSPEGAAADEDPGLSLKSLIELFGRPARNPQHWMLESTAFRLEDLDR
ncbi:MAG: hypothetical protein ABSF98_27365 [Bryobacteraceae bacterium]